MFKTIVWATDGSHGAALALEQARRLEPKRIIAVHCNERLSGRALAFPVLPDEDERRARIRAFVALLREEGLDIELVVRRTHGSPADVIADVADEHHADAIVCGTRGLGAFRSALAGSVARRLLHLAHCPVLVVPEHAVVRAAERPLVAAS